jgi:ABC-type transporter Mla MlaB component
VATQDFVVHVHSGEGDARLALSGELDRGVVSALAEAYREVSASADAVRVVIDVSGLEFCDLSGQRELFRCHAAGATLVGAPFCLRRLCELTGHQHVLPVSAGDPWPRVSFASGVVSKDEVVGSA